VWTSTADIEANWRLDATFEPQLDRGAVEAQQVLWARAVGRAHSWALDEA
jgi:glycerol kinase